MTNIDELQFKSITLKNSSAGVIANQKSKRGMNSCSSKNF